MKVSVALMTYNHEKFIAQAIESVLMQEVDEEFEIIIGEDCSQDRTGEIVRGYQARNPDKIRVLTRDRNIGMMSNWIETLNSCTGKYIALLDGDDYWTSPHKLQRQVDFLDTHPEFAICFHNALVFYENGSRKSHTYCHPDLIEITVLDDLFAGDYIPTCSVMFRAGLFEEFPGWFHMAPAPDWLLHILNAQHGKIGYINEIMGAYRVHEGGAWSGQSKLGKLKMLYRTYGKISAHLGSEFEISIREAMLKGWDNYIEIFFEQGLEEGATHEVISNASEALDHWPIEVPLSDREKDQLLGKVYALMAFSSYKAHDLSMARYSLIRAILSDPSWLNNRGVWSIAVEAVLGQWIANLLRRSARRLWPKSV